MWIPKNHASKEVTVSDSFPLDVLEDVAPEEIPSAFRPDIEAQFNGDSFERRAAFGIFKHGNGNPCINRGFNGKSSIHEGLLIAVLDYQTVCGSTFFKPRATDFVDLCRFL